MNLYSGSGDPPDRPPRKRRTKHVWRRRILWSAGVVVLLLVAAGGFSYWWLTSRLDAITNVDVAVNKARSHLQQIRNLPLAKQVATILVIGSDHRYTDGTAPPRSDTLMLVRVDPIHHVISLLSIPRDLWVDIPTVGWDKINAAFSQGRNGPTLALETVQQETGVHPNYLAVINFSGFKSLVSDMGGVYIPVDQNYQHSNAGLPTSETYSEIHIDPGYQLLTGPNALAFARYRHTDSDFYRNARQQLFLHQFEQAAANRFHGISVTDLPTIVRLIDDVSKNLEFTGRNKPSLSTMRQYAALIYSLHGHIVTTRLTQETTAVIGGADVVQDPTSDMQHTVYLFKHPWKIAQPGNQLPKQPKAHTKKFKPAVKPGSVPRLAVLNGTDRQGLAAKVANGLGSWGYRTTDGNAPNARFTHTWIFYSAPAYRAAAHDLARILGVGAVAPTPSRFAARAKLTAKIAVVLGTTYSGKLHYKAPKVAAPKLPADMTATQDYLTDFRNAAHAAHLPGMYPTAIPTASSLQDFSYSQPIRTYNIKAAGSGPNSLYAYWQYNGIAGSYFGIEETRFVDAPILQNPSASRTINGHRFQFYFNGSHIYMVALIDNVHHVVYWVQNTLLNDLSNADMIAIARSLQPTR
jgi:LCP family protein required for cell wall assembly